MRVKIKPEFSRYYDTGHFDVSVEHDAVDDLVNGDMYFLCNKWYVFKSHADIVGKTDKLDIHEEKSRRLQPSYQREQDQNRSSDLVKRVVPDKSILEKATPLMDRITADTIKLRELFPELTPSDFKKAKLDSAKLHKDISSTILLVLARNEKINQLSGRELLSLVGEIADGVVKDVESYKLNQK